MTRKALVIGATGLIGRNLVFELLKSPQYSQVTVLTRRDLVIKHDKLNQIILDFDDLMQYRNHISGDDIFCCLGSTRAKTPDESIYRKIDFEYPLTVARIAKENGASRYYLVSSLGASTESRFFYSRIKAETEDAIASLNYTAFLVFRPSLLLGARTESRPVETVSQYLMRALNPLMLGPLKLYKAIRGSVVAKAMYMAACKQLTGHQLILNHQIFDLAEGK